jgi:predicted TPR repeat methyltransferase
MSNSWDDYAEGWDSNQDVRIYAQRAFDALTMEVDIQGLRVLDFGCGTGLLTEKMVPFAESIVALDASEKMCSILKEKRLENVYILTGFLTENKIESEPLLQKPFDLIVASSVLTFIDDYVSILKLLQSRLCRGGLLVQWDWKKTAQEPEFGFDSEDLVRNYQQAGMSLKAIKEPFALESEKGAMTVIMGIAKNEN